MTYKLIDYERLKAFSDSLKSKYATKSDLPKKLADLQEDTTHRLVTDEDKEILQKSVKGISIGVKAGEPDLFFNVGRNDLTASSTKIPLAENSRHGLMSKEDKKKVDAIPPNPKYTDTIPDLSGYATKSELNKKIDKSSISDNFIGQSKDKILSQKGAYELGMQLSIEIDNATKTKAEKADIPTRISQLENDKTFKTEAEIQSMIEKASSLKKEVVTSLSSTGKDDVIYLVKDENGKDNNNYLEYLWLNGKYELIGSTQVDLSGYAKKEDVLNRELDKATASDVYNKTGSGKYVDANLLNEVRVDLHASILGWIMQNVTLQEFTQQELEEAFK